MSTDPSADINKREHFRQPMFVAIQLRAKGKPELIPATLVNLSGGGCQVNTSVLLDTRFVGFDLAYPGNAALPLNGRIRKIRHVKSSSMYYYGIEFEFGSERVREDLLRFIAEEQLRVLRNHHVSEVLPDTPKRLREQRIAQRVATNFLTAYTVLDKPGETFEGTVVNISTGGLRMVTDQMLRREWSLELNFTLPQDIVQLLDQARGPDDPPIPNFLPMTLLAHPMPGIRNSHGRYVHSLSFRRPDTVTLKEITRFIKAAAQLTRGRPPQ